MGEHAPKFLAQKEQKSVDKTLLLSAGKTPSPSHTAFNVLSDLITLQDALNRPCYIAARHRTICFVCSQCRKNMHAQLRYDRYKNFLYETPFK